MSVSDRYRATDHNRYHRRFRPPPNFILHIGRHTLWKIEGEDSVAMWNSINGKWISQRPTHRPDIMSLYMPPHIFRLTNFRVPPKVENGPDGKQRIV